MLLDTNVVSNFLKPSAETRLPRLNEFVQGLLASQTVAISFFTQFELLRGLEELRLRGQGRRQLVALRKFLDHCEVIGLDAAGGWDHAADLWARGRAHKPSIVFKDADLLIAATASFHGRTFVTSEIGLVQNLHVLGVLDVRRLPLE